MSNNRQGRYFILIMAAGFEGGLGVAAWGLGWFLDQPPLQNIRWDVCDALLGLGACLPLLLAFLACLRWPAGPLDRIKQFSEQVVRDWFAPCTLLDLVVIALLAGVGEEMLFRGILQPVLGRWLGPLAGLLVTSVLFGLLHPITPAYVVIAGLMGAYLGWLQVITDNLLVPMITHTVYDFLALAYLARRPAPKRTLD